MDNLIKRGKNRKLRLDMVYQMDNLIEADRCARKGKGKHRGVRTFDKRKKTLLPELQTMIMNETYHTSPGTDVEQLCPCGKIRLLHKLPYYPDHIEHHALMQVIMPTMMKYYYYDSSASIKGKGIHFAAKRTRKWIDKHKNAGRLYYCKLDFVKFYHNIDQQKCYECLSKTFGDKGLRRLLKEVVTACDNGLGIGLYPIQPIANFYSCRLCRLVMQRFCVFIEIYCDDIVVLSENKKEVWRAINFIQQYAKDVMCQPLHTNVGVQIIDETHGLDFVGYRFFLFHTKIRKRMKKRFKRKMARLKDPIRRYRVAVSYRGWLMHCNGFNLWKKIMNMKSFKDIQIPKYEKKDKNGKRILDGAKTSISMLLEQQLEFLDVELGIPSKFDKQSAAVQVKTQQGKIYKFLTSGPRLLQIFKFVVENNELPFTGRIINKNTAGYPDYDITD